MGNTELAKLCRRCTRRLPIDRFDTRAEPGKGARAYCRDCLDPNALDKYCTKCQQRKPVEQFNRRGKRDIVNMPYKSRCRECEYAYGAQWRANNKDKIREYSLRQNFGLSLSDYEQMLGSQAGLCALCGRPPEIGTYLNVDHDHTTGRVRALIHSQCNTMLGMSKDSIEVLSAAIDYLRRHQVTS